MTKIKSIQIPEELFFNLVKYFILELSDPELEQAIAKAISDKFEKMVDRDLFSKSRNQELPSEQREQFRQEYLARRGII